MVNEQANVKIIDLFFKKKYKFFRIPNFYNLVIQTLKLQLATVKVFSSSTEEHPVAF